MTDSNNVNVKPSKVSRKPDNKPDNKPDGSKPEVAAWKPNGLPDNADAELVVSGWKSDYDDACSKWATWSTDEKQSFADALAKRLGSACLSSMVDDSGNPSARNCGGYIRLAYNPLVRNYVRSITCTDNTIGLDVRKWAMDLANAYLRSDADTVKSCKSLTNPGYKVLDSHCKARNKPLVVAWIGGSVSKHSAGGSGEYRD